MPNLTPTKNILYYTPALGWGIFMTVYTLMPRASLPQQLLNMNDKLLHLGIYFFTASLIYLARQRYNLRRPLSARFLWNSFFICLLYGGLIELLQHFFVTNRHGEWLDFVANGLGALLALLTFQKLARSNT